MSDADVPLDNKQLRLYNFEGKYARFSVEEIIAQGKNAWKGWHCSAGARNLYIDYDGNIWVANCASSGRNEGAHVDLWKNWLNSEWKRHRTEVFGEFPHLEWLKENTEYDGVELLYEADEYMAKLNSEMDKAAKEFFYETPRFDPEVRAAWKEELRRVFGKFPYHEWLKENTDWDGVTELRDLHPALKQLETEFKQVEDDFFDAHNISLKGPLYRKFLKEGGGWRWFSTETDKDSTWGLLGSIFNDWRVPQTWTKCPFNNCGCGADVILSKVKDSQYVDYLAVSEDGYDGQYRTRNDVIPHVDEGVALEMNFPIDYQILWDLSRKCNFDCSYCWPSVHNNTDKHYDYEVIKQTMDRAIDNWAGGEQIRWNFGGGEPTLHPNFLDIIKHLKSKNQWTMVTTNGSRTNRYWKEARQYLNTANFSCHFEGVDLELFISNIELVAEWHDQVADDFWIEVKLMTPPGVVHTGIETKKRIEALETWQRPGANGRPKGAVVLVPIRDINTASSMVAYSDEELELLRNQ